MTETQPLFSVVIPTYNRSNAVVKAVKSVLAQTYTNFEVIVVDDGSTDDTSSKIEQLTKEDARVIYVFQENQERSASRNNGVALAKGAFICFLDSDDIYEPEHLFLLKKTIDQGEETAALYHVNGKLKAGEKTTQITFPKHIAGENTLEYVLLKAIIPTSFVCISTSILQEHRFNTELYVGEDRELWSRIAANHPIVLSNQFTVVQNDLGDRTVDIANLKTAEENLRTAKLILSAAATKLSTKVKRKVLSASYFKLAQSYLANNYRFRASVFTIRAILLYQDKYTPSLFVFLIKALGLGFLLPARFKQV